MATKKGFYELCAKIVPAIVAISSVLSNVVPYEEETAEWVKFTHEVLDLVALNNHDHDKKICLK